LLFLAVNILPDQPMTPELMLPANYERPNRAEGPQNTASLANRNWWLK
jgi:hypothetical protein